MTGTWRVIALVAALWAGGNLALVLYLSEIYRKER